MKPFNLEEALAGKPIVDGRGNKVLFTKLSVPKPNGSVGISQLPSGNYQADHFSDGRSTGGYPEFTLFMVPTSKTYWVNLFESPSTHYSKHDTEAQADFYAKHRVSCAGKKTPPDRRQSFSDHRGGVMTTKKTIEGWLERGLSNKDSPTHLVVVCDTYDWDDYPVYVFPDQDVRQIVKQFSGNMQKVMEVYNLALPLDKQLNEHRSFNY